MKDIGNSLVEVQMSDGKEFITSIDFLPPSEIIRTAFAALYHAVPNSDLRAIVRRLHAHHGLSQYCLFLSLLLGHSGLLHHKNGVGSLIPSSGSPKQFFPVFEVVQKSLKKPF